MDKVTIREEIPHAHPIWCYYGRDVIPFTLPQCLDYKRGVVTLLENSRGEARIVSEPEPGARGDLEIVVEWRHGFFGNVTYKLEAEVEESRIEGTSIFFKSIDITPSPIKLGGKCSMTITLHNCGTERFKSKYDPPRADSLFAIKELDYLNRVTGEPTGETRRISDYEGWDRVFSFRTDLDIGPGEDFTVTREEEIPGGPALAGFAGTYRTQMFLESIDLESSAPNTVIAISNPITIRIEV